MSNDGKFKKISVGKCESALTDSVSGDLVLTDDRGNSSTLADLLADKSLTPKSEQLSVTESQTAFTLSETPVTNSINLYRNGQWVHTFTATGASITWTGQDFDGSETLYAQYWYQG